ncbi:MAG: hypothetical protein IJ809_06265 [Clostridia bacterium]|nr:hypothetical protein [Clostridia bacterium]
MSKSIKESVVNRYINEYYKEVYKISKEKQPNFWEAVRKLCLDPNADVTNLIISNENYCVCTDYIYRYNHISNVVEEAENVLDAIKIISTEIINNEKRKDVNVELFLLEKRVKRLEERTDSISSHHTVYY